jgi:hypothetical protein
MSRTVDDFTIVLPQLGDMGACDLEVYSEITQLWQMVERYKMTTPITIKIVDHNAGYIRTIRGRHDQIAAGDCTMSQAQSIRPLPARSSSRLPYAWKMPKGTF